MSKDFKTRKLICFRNRSSKDLVYLDALGELSQSEWSLSQLNGFTKYGHSSSMRKCNVGQEQDLRFMPTSTVT